MIIFLTSSFVEYQPKKYIPKPVDPSNGFVENLKKYWKENSNFLVFTSDPADKKNTDHVTVEMRDAFSLAGLSLGEVRYFDYRTIENYKNLHNCTASEAPYEALKEALAWADVFYLAGGHAPTENAFMKSCRLKELVNNKEFFDGIFIGLSAGAVNAAENVYIPPELKGEAIDPNFVRFTDGLGLTTINIMPHIDYEKTVILDGMKLIDEILAADSMGREFYLIPDGSYFVIRNGITEFFGEGEILENGRTRPLHSGIIHSDNRRLRFLSTNLIDENARILMSAIVEKYDCLMEVDVLNGTVDFYHVSKFWLDNGIIPIHIDTFTELVSLVTEKIIVPEERSSVLEQVATNVILDEIDNKGSYTRTVHCDDASRIKADQLRATFVAGNRDRLLVIFADISQILDHDWMTDEYSRSGFITRAEQLLKNPEYHKGYSIVYTNISGYKAVNDLLGTHSGDMVIFMTRDKLVEIFNPILIARLESDHFALITKSSNLSKKNLDKICHQSYVEETKCMPILIRCGICHISDFDCTVTTMLDRAELAEKNISNTAHGNFFAVCDHKMVNDYRDRRFLVSEIDAALSKKEFETFYQPVVNAHTGEIVSAEALIRWNHHVRGRISPGVFVPIFEKEGHITKLDSFMMDNVLTFNIDRMSKNEKYVPCAVNLSRVDFYDITILNMIKEKMESIKWGSHKKAGDLLKLEVTESAYIVLESNAVSFLKEIKKLGIMLMLDDFGRGMSSMSTLESFEFDAIKLDMSFVAQIGKSSRAEAIIKHTIGLSHDIGASVIAEGVENEKQLAFLRDAGCDMIQGYYFYKPMPEEEFAKLLS